MTAPAGGARVRPARRADRPAAARARRGCGRGRGPLGGGPGPGHADGAARLLPGQAQDQLAYLSAESGTSVTELAAQITGQQHTGDQARHGHPPATGRTSAAGRSRARAPEREAGRGGSGGQRLAGPAGRRGHGDRGRRQRDRRGRAGGGPGPGGRGRGGAVAGRAGRRPGTGRAGRVRCAGSQPLAAHPPGHGHRRPARGRRRQETWWPAGPPERGLAGARAPGIGRWPRARGRCCRCPARRAHRRHGDLLARRRSRSSRPAAPPAGRPRRCLRAGPGPPAAHGDLAAGPARRLGVRPARRHAGVRPVRERDPGRGGQVADFRIRYLSEGFTDPAGRPAGGYAGRPLLEVYPAAALPGGLFERAAGCWPPASRSRCPARCISTPVGRRHGWRRCWTYGSPGCTTAS